MEIERIVPGTIAWDAFYANHIHRYIFALDQLSGRPVETILDAACGVGYGTNFIASGINAKIIGIDISADTIAYAKKNFYKDNVIYLEDDCSLLTHASSFAPFDAIVSFETIEHLPDPATFLRSAFVNLKTGGVFIASTPNANLTSPDGKVTWQFHEKEYTAKAFYELLVQAGFNNIKLYGQVENMKGSLKKELRAELHRLYRNPFVRFGKWMQNIFNGYKPLLILKEQTDDFDIISFTTAEECDRLKERGPFVLIAVAQK